MNFKRISNIIILIFFGMSQIKTAGAKGLPLPPGEEERLTLSEEFSPANPVGLKVHPQNPLQFNFFVEPGQQSLSLEEKQAQYQTFAKYFLAALTVEEKDLWVNLSPYEKERIIPDTFGQTEMGRDLLAQDYVLKKLTASVMHPEND